MAARDLVSETMAIVAGVLNLTLAAIAILYLFTIGEMFWVTVIFMLNLVALERLMRYYESKGKLPEILPAEEHLFVGIVSIAIFVLVELGGLLVAPESRAPYLLFLFAFYQVMRWMSISLRSWHISGLLRYSILGLAFIAGFWFFYWAGLGSDFSNAGQLFGEAGYGVGQAINTGVQAVSTRIAAFSNTALSPQRNPNIARMVCTWQMFSSGSFTSGGSAAIENCVDKKLGKNETKTESKKVTQPVTVTIPRQDVTFEPLSNHLRVTFTIKNTLVYDLQNRPIRIPARDVKVYMNFSYLGETQAQLSTDRFTIPNGEERVITFNKDSSGDPLIPIVRTTSTMTRRDVIRLLEDIRAYCIDGDNKEACNTAEQALVNATKPDKQNLNKNRVAFLIRSKEGAAKRITPKEFRKHTDHSGLQEIKNALDKEMLLASSPNQKRSYQVKFDIQYDYSAEAAFTESSRWRSGNHLLEIYTKPAWEQLSPQERDAFEQRKCKTVTRYGETVMKQRTVALTTPIVPVMYTDCSTTLFNRFTAPDFQGTVPIHIGATVNDQQIRSEDGFKINGATTTCVSSDSGGPKVLKRPDQGPVFKFNRETTTNPWFDRVAGVGFRVNPETVERQVTIQGQRISIGCSVSMNFTINKRISTSYAIPYAG